MKVLSLSKQLAVQAGIKIMEIYEGGFDFELKQDNSPITIADRQSNEIIVQGLAEHFPDYAILSEETRDDKSRLDNDYCFIVDPLDGTKEFIKRNGQFTVNIALVYKHKPIMGVIYVPVTKDLYYASYGDGAYIENMDTGKIKKLHASDKVSQLTMVGSKSHSSDSEKALYMAHKDIVSETLSAGSSLKGCMVASGQADIYYRFGFTSEWDTAAMQCIIEEAGGIFNQMDNSEMLYNRENNLNEKGFYVVNRKENIWV